MLCAHVNNIAIYNVREGVVNKVVNDDALKQRSWIRRRLPLNEWILAALSQALIVAFAAPLTTCLFDYSSGSVSSWANRVWGDLPIFYAVFYVGLVVAWLIAFVTKLILPGFFSHLLPGASVSHNYQTVSDYIAERSLLNKNEVAEADKFLVTEDVGNRVEALRSRTRAILATMGVSLVAAAIVVLFAGRLTSLDATAVSNVDRLKSDITDSKRRLARLYQFETVYRQYEAATKSGASKEQVDRLDRQVGNLRDDTPSPQDLVTTDALIELEKVDLAKLGELLNGAWLRELSAEKGNGDWKYIVATAITRVGVVLVIVYLVQILMNFYRYNTRLITYYNSRRDLLTLWDGKQRDLKSLEQALAPSKIDFGKEPRHPLEDVIKAAGAKLTSGDPRGKKPPVVAD
jgi:hypothetical protein